MPSRPPKRQAGAALDSTEWARLLEAFRKEGPKFHAVASAAGVNYRTARKAWDNGLAVKDERGQITSKLPARLTIAREQEGARAAVAASEVLEAAGKAGERGQVVEGDPATIAAAIGAGRVPAAVVRELSSQEAITSLAEEGRMLRVNRSNVGGLVAISSNLLKGAVKASLKLQGALEMMKIEHNTPEAIQEGARAVNAVVMVAAMTTQAVRRHLQAERLFLGDPRQQVYEHALQGAPGPDANYTHTLEEAIYELQRLAPYAARYLPPGGANGDQEGDEDAPTLSGEEGGA